MHQRREQHRLSRAVKNPSPLTDLFVRIHTEHLRNEQYERRAHFKYTFIYLLITLFVLYIFGCHTRVYNALAGPFHLNLDQFAMYLDKYNHLDLDEHSGKSRWFLFHREYLQVELGENQIEQEAKNIINIYSDQSLNKRLLYTLNKIKELNIVVNLYPDNLYVKLATTEKNHFHSHLSYRFQSFTVQTLRCIVRQLDISPNEYMQWIEKIMYIRTIEQIYAQNATAFNIKVIVKCGILIGYLYRPKGELAYAANSKYAVQFKKLDIALDASSSYYPYKTFLFGGLLFSWLFLKSIFYFLVYLFHAISRPTLRIHPAVEKYLNVLQIDSLQKLDHLLLNTADENNYHNRLYLVRDRYLLLLNIDCNEYNASILHRFYVQEPITIVHLENIIPFEHNEFLMRSGSEDIWLSLPTIRSISDEYGAEWLHQRLMQISTTYRYHYEEQKRFQNEKRYQEQQEEENRRRLAILIVEEEQHQRTAYLNNFEATWTSIIPASPRFIAQFRLMTSQHVDDDLYDTLCTICRENLQFGEYYAQWSCEAKHVFHYNCMLNVLRTQHTCPLCRHAVERSDFAVGLMVSQYFSRVFM